VGRIGCFLSGIADQTYGVATALPWGHDFGDGVLRHPVQLYEAAAALALFAALYAAYPHRRHAGQITAWFCLLYATWRLVIETLRADAAGWRPGAPWWQLNVFQWLSLALLLVATAVLYAARRAPITAGEGAD